MMGILLYFLYRAWEVSKSKKKNVCAWFNNSCTWIHNLRTQMCSKCNSVLYILAPSLLKSLLCIILKRLSASKAHLKVEVFWIQWCNIVKIFTAFLFYTLACPQKTPLSCRGSVVAAVDELLSICPVCESKRSPAFSLLHYICTLGLFLTDRLTSLMCEIHL